MKCIFKSWFLGIIWLWYTGLNLLCFYSQVFDVMFKFAKTSMTLNKSSSNGKAEGRFREKFSLFGEACLDFVASFYEKACQMDCVLTESILFKLTRVLNAPLRQKYRCYTQSNWRLAIKVLLKVRWSSQRFWKISVSGFNWFSIIWILVPKNHLKKKYQKIL